MATIRQLDEGSKLGTYTKNADENIEQNKRDISLNVFDTWLNLFLMYLPIAGWGVAVYFCFSKASSPSRKSLAIATIINKFILLTALIALFILINNLLSGVVQTLQNTLLEISKSQNAIEEMMAFVQQIVNTINLFVI